MSYHPKQNISNNQSIQNFKEMIIPQSQKNQNEKILSIDLLQNSIPNKLDYNEDTNNSKHHYSENTDKNILPENETKISERSYEEEKQI